MNKIRKKIVKKVICTGCIVLIIGGIAKLNYNNDKFIPATNIFSENTPVIVLDAGHAECT